MYQSSSRKYGLMGRIVMSRMPTDQECAKAEKVIEEVTKQCFPEADILEVKVEGHLDRDDPDPYFLVRIIFDSPSGELDSVKSRRSSQLLRPKLEEVGLFAYPAVTYVPKKYAEIYK